MKLTLLIAALTLSAVSAFGQGQLIFANNSATTITNALTGLPVPGSAAQDDTQVGLYVGNVGESPDTFQLIGNVTNCFTAGRWSGGTRTLTGWTGTVQLQVRAWLASTVYPSYEVAVAATLGGDASVLVGVSAPFDFTLTQPPALATSIANAGLTAILIAPYVPPPQFNKLFINDILVGESSGTANFSVALVRANASPVTVNYTTGNGTAVAGSDYQARTGTLNFSPGQTNKQIAIPILADAVPEGDEAFVVTLSNPVNAQIFDRSGTCTIGGVFHMTSVALRVDVAFSTLNGARYRVERTDNAVTWSPVIGATNVLGTGSIVTITDSNAGCQPMRAYRAMRFR